MKMTWNEEAKKRFEAGCSDVALFVGVPKKDLAGVPWDGMTGIDVSPDGADANDNYANNVKWITLRGDENEKGNMKAFMYPVELNKCTGYKRVGNKAIYVGQQSRTPCSFAWKTKVGNAEKGLDYSEKLHIVYGATIGPVSNSSATINKDPAINVLQWDWSATPLTIGTINGEYYKPTAIIELERDEETADIYDAVCDYIYGKDPTTTGGSDGTEPKLLLPADIIKMATTSGS